MGGSPGSPGRPKWPQPVLHICPPPLHHAHSRQHSVSHIKGHLLPQLRTPAAPTPSPPKTQEGPVSAVPRLCHSHPAPAWKGLLPGKPREEGNAEPGTGQHHPSVLKSEGRLLAQNKHQGIPRPHPTHALPRSPQLVNRTLGRETHNWTIRAEALGDYMTASRRLPSLGLCGFSISGPWVFVGFGFPKAHSNVTQVWGLVSRVRVPLPH